MNNMSGPLVILRLKGLLRKPGENLSDVDAQVRLKPPGLLLPPLRSCLRGSFRPALVINSKNCIKTLFGLRPLLRQGDQDLPFCPRI